jgi:uncharacterized protein with HEPN domain
MDAAAILLEDVRKQGHQAFRSDVHLQAAAIRYLEIIGEAAGNLSASLRELHPEIPVRQMRGFASFAKHEYWRIDTERLWAAIGATGAIRRTLASIRAEDSA